MITKYTWQEVLKMDREEILNKAQNENKGKDPADRDAQKDGSFLAYIVGVCLLIIVDTVNGFVFHNVNRGPDFALFSMAFIVFLVKYIKLRRKHELVTAIIWGVLALAMLAVWILQMARVI